MLCEFARELDQLKAEVATLKAMNAANILPDFRDHPDGILAFIRDFSVPFNNNPSERDLRMMKLRQRISGAFRSVDALVDFCRIRGYVSTDRKNGINALDALRRVFPGEPSSPPSTPRSRTCSPASTPAENHALYIWTNYRLAKILLSL